MSRRVPLVLVVLVVLVATGVVTDLRPATNPVTLPAGLTVSMNAESTALYCTGIARSSGPAGRVTFYNTASAPRSLSVSVVSNQGNTWHGTIELGAHGQQSLQPAGVDKAALGDNYAVAVQISGGGVVGEEIAGTNATEVPCLAAGVTRWAATGFDTLTGSSAYLSIYNPTATAAVFNTAIYTASGSSAPEAYQGVSVPAHTQTELELGKEVVNTENIGVVVTVLRGSLAITGVENSAGTVSFEAGLTSAATKAWYPSVTTAVGASAAVRVLNPSSQRANVSLNVHLGSFTVAPQTLSLAPYSTGEIPITPNPAVPAAGYANVALHSNVAVVSSLATGTSAWVALSSPTTPSDAFVVSDFSDKGFDAATVTNTSSHNVVLSIESVPYASSHGVTSVKTVTLSGGETLSLFSIIESFSSTPSDTYLLTSVTPSLVVAMTLPSKPEGQNVVGPLNGR